MDKTYEQELHDILAEFNIPLNTFQLKTVFNRILQAKVAHIKEELNV